MNTEVIGSKGISLDQFLKMLDPFLHDANLNFNDFVEVTFKKKIAKIEEINLEVELFLNKFDESMTQILRLES